MPRRLVLSVQSRGLTFDRSGQVVEPASHVCANAACTKRCKVALERIVALPERCTQPIAAHDYKRAVVYTGWSMNLGTAAPVHALTRLNLSRQRMVFCPPHALNAGPSIVLR